MKKVYVLIVILAIVILILIGIIFITNGIYQNKRLFKAIEQNNYEMAEDAIKKGAWINLRKELIWSHMWLNPTPLVEACRSENKEIITLLIESGADINKTDPFTAETPLLATVKGERGKDRFRNAMYIISKGGDIHKETPSHTVFSWALYIDEDDSEETVADSVNLIKYLIENDVDQKIFGWENALTHAAHYSNYGAVDYLIRGGYYDVDCKDREGDTALIVAAKHNQIRVVKVLIDHKATLNLCDTLGKTALDYAIENGNEEMIRLLEEAEKQ